MNLRQKTAVIMLTALAGTACASAMHDMTGPVLRRATDAPVRFVFDMAVDTALTDTIPGWGCRNPLLDPRDSTAITMSRSASGLADYAVPSGKYGVGQNELLRVECNTGLPLGIVRR